jgi:hypothetical protein
VTASAYPEIAQVLDRARRRRGWIALGTAAAAGMAGVLVCLLPGAILLGREAGRLSAIRGVTLALAALVGGCALVWAVVALGRLRATPLAAARRVGEAAPELRSDLLSSVEFDGEYEELERSGRYSVALVDALIVSTADRVRHLDLSRVVPSTSLRRAAAALAVASLANLAAFVIVPRAVRGGWSRLFGAGPPAQVRLAEPITGDVEITYHYPDYMHRDPKTISGTGGEISAPCGTEVRLAARADRQVEEAEIALALEGGKSAATANPAAAPPAQNGPPASPTSTSGASPPIPPTANATATGPRLLKLTVKNGRDLEGRFVVDEGGSYRFRFVKGRKVLAEGPPLPIAVEPDAFPEVRITSPGQSVEVDARARVRVEFSASDDFGLRELTLVMKPPQGEERRTVLRTFTGGRREVGAHELDLAPVRLGEGEQLLYWLEVTDTDTVSGPKRSASATHEVKIYSEAEHHRLAVEKVHQVWEEMVRLLGDRLELFDGAPWTPERIVQAGALDLRTRALHENLASVSRELRQDRSAPRALPVAVANVAAALREIEEGLSTLRRSLSRVPRHAGQGGLLDRMVELDRRLDRELEKDILYLEELLDQQRADDLVRMARDLAARRRDLAQLLEAYRKAPSEAKKEELLAEVARLKARMQEMMRRMAELAKGFSDEHMNREALAEILKSRDALGGIDEVGKMLARGDVEGAMKALDQLGNTMQDMLSSLERTAGRPGEQNAALMKDMLAFKKQLEQVQAEQEQVARETEKVKGEYRRRLSRMLEQLEAEARRLEGLTAEARREVQKAERGVTLRSEDDFAQARDRLADLEKALQGRDFDAAMETSRRALPPMQRLALGLEDDAAAAERYRQLAGKDPREIREAQRHAAGAVGPARKVKEELERMLPDPRSVLGEREQERLGELAQQQGQLEGKAGQLRQRLAELSQRAPVFPPQAQEMLGGSQGHMQRAQGELAVRNPQRGHGEQRLALDDLARFRRGLDEMAKKMQGSGGGPPFPFPFGEESAGGEGGLDPSHEKVEIPGADQYRVPEEFRRDLLEAMKQGSPEPYKGEVQRYYEELVK